MPSKYGFGNTRKKSPYKTGKASYGMDQKNPIKNNGKNTTKKMESLPPKILPTGLGRDLGNEADAKSIYSGYEHVEKFSTNKEKMKRYRAMQKNGYKGDPPK